MKFTDRIAMAMEAADSLLCVGLDPQPARTPAEELLEFNTRVVEATADLTCAYKPQSAFYEAHGLPGWQALADTVAMIRQAAPHALVIIDAKRGDIGHSSAAYAQAVFDVFGADALTVSPYLGGDAVGPFLERPDHGAFLLCRTSNPGGADLQCVPTANGEPLYLTVAERIQEWSDAHHGNAGLVVGATFPDELARVRERCPELPILLPGIGAQGGDLETSVAAGMDKSARGLLVSASRSVIYAGDEEAIRAEALRLAQAINSVRARG